ncbi:uncharacterized protein LOC115634617 [Scaptodrosophila lebanonensis]|uniref:Uncharacterized protein LOC115634617 n=1 Tax=Drosophila lebanonensis TaxID=7225 RepID=A0A6J2UJG0_DROLE|nr:uncharacterized protein LOC115634617 [Scaptodrosophila lebanonensis]
MWKLRYFLAQNFDEFEFVAGTKQAAKAMIDAVRSLDWSQINKFCTPQSSGDIYALAQEYRKQLYPAIVRFDVDHFRTAMPTSVRTRYISDRWYLCVDMAFLGLRNVRDFDTQSEQQEMLKLTDQVLEKSKLQSHLTPGHQRIVLGELLLTFHRELIGSEANGSKLDYEAVAEPEAMSEPTDGWLIDNYKMHKIRLVNYSPVTMQYRIIEFRS